LVEVAGTVVVELFWGEDRIQVNATGCAGAVGFG
jgi:hypothetical protein